MIDALKAKEIAQNWLNKERLGEKATVRAEFTREFSFGWLIYYDLENNRQITDRENIFDGLPPLIVDRADGSVHPVGKSETVGHYLLEYERQRSSKITSPG